MFAELLDLPPSTHPWYWSHLWSWALIILGAAELRARRGGR